MVIRKVGKKWVLYPRHKKKGQKRKRRLGTHDSRAAALQQERAIKARGG